jgi:hypothetical protein
VGRHPGAVSGRDTATSSCSSDRAGLRHLSGGTIRYAATTELRAKATWPDNRPSAESDFSFADQFLLGCQCGGTVPRHILTRAHEIGAFWSNGSSSQARRTTPMEDCVASQRRPNTRARLRPRGHSHMTLALKRTLRPRDVPETDTVGGTLTPPTHVERIRPGKSIACRCFAIIWHTAARLGSSPPVGSQRRLNR